MVLSAAQRYRLEQEREWKEGRISKRTYLKRIKNAGAAIYQQEQARAQGDISERQQVVSQIARQSVKNSTPEKHSSSDMSSTTIEQAQRQARDNLRPVGAPSASQRFTQDEINRLNLAPGVTRPGDKVTVTQPKRQPGYIRAADRSQYTVFDTAREYGERIEQPGIGKTGVKAYGQRAVGGTIKFGADFTEGFKDTVTDWRTYAVAGGALAIGATGTVAGAAVLGGAAGYAFYSEARAIGNKDTTIGASGGRFAGFGVVSGGLSKAAEYTNFRTNLKRAIKFTATGGSSVSVVGGKSARLRAGRMSKAELRKQSYNARRNPNIFQDTQTGETGFRIRSQGLKEQQFVKERVVRVGATESGPQYTQVKDVLTGGRGSLVSRGDVSFTGKGSTPSLNKQYPKGFGSQSISKVSSSDSLVGATLLVRQNLAFRQISTPKTTGSVPKSQFIDNPPVFSETGVATVGVKQNTFYPKYNYKTQSTYQTGGFRKGYGDKLYARLQTQARIRSTQPFISDISGADLVPPASRSSGSLITSNAIKPTTGSSFRSIPVLSVQSDTSNAFKTSSTPITSINIISGQSQKIGQASAFMTDVSYGSRLDNISIQQPRQYTPSRSQYVPQSRTFTPSRQVLKPITPTYSPTLLVNTSKVRRTRPQPPERVRQTFTPSIRFRLSLPRGRSRSTSTPSNVIGKQLFARTPTARAASFQLKPVSFAGQDFSGLSDRLVVRKKGRRVLL